jgi:hypothetical protein
MNAMRRICECGVTLNPGLFAQPRFHRPGCPLRAEYDLAREVVVNSVIILISRSMKQDSLMPSFQVLNHRRPPAIRGVAA